MYCPNCGTVVPEGSRFCLNCGSEIYQQPVQPKKKKAGKVIVIFLILAIIAVGAVLGVTLYEREKAKEEKEKEEEIVEIPPEEAIIGYWESTSRVRVDKMLENILEDNDIPDAAIDFIVKALDLSDEEVILGLQFYEDETLRIAINGNMMSKKKALNYEILGKTRCVLTCPSKTFLDLTDLKASFKGISLEGLNFKLETGDISHTFKYEIKEDEMEVEVFDEKITLEKLE